MAVKKGLGKGLSALITSSPEESDPEKSGIVEIDIHKIEPNQHQPRKQFDEASLLELAQSIREFGIIAPIIVREREGYYTIIAGERRWRAARLARLETVPVIIKEYNDLQIIQIALIENIQRKDLNPIEEASCFKRLVEEYFFKQEDIAEKIGRSRQYVSNMMSLLSLDSRVREFIMEGKITAYHGRILLAAKDEPALQYEMADRIIEEDLSARAAETLLRNLLKEKKEKEVEKPPLSKQDYTRVEQDLKSIFGTKVQIKDGKNNRGKIEIEYYSQDELDRLLGIMKQMEA